MRLLCLVCLCLTAAWAGEAPSPLSDRFYNAIRNNDLATLRTLTEAKTVNVADARGGTPLMYAALIGSPEAVKLLLDAGADVQAKNSFGLTPLVLGASDVRKVRLLLAKGADVSARSKMGRGALFVAAAQNGNAEAVRLLLEKGADINAADDSKMTPLLAAAGANDVGSLRALLEAGADANTKDAFGNSALMAAAGFGNLETMRLLLAKGADVNAVTGKTIGPPVKNGPIDLGNFTALMLAAPNSGADAVRMLLDAGAKVNVQEVRGMTPLMLAVATDHPDPATVALLVAHGADLSARSKLGETALDWARKFNDPRVLKALGAKPAQAGPVVLEAATEKTPSARAAIGRSAPLLQKTTQTFFEQGACVACHAQNLTGIALHALRENGLPVDEANAAAHLKATQQQWAFFEPLLMQSFHPPGGPGMLEWSLLPMAREKAPAGHVTDVMVHALAREQQKDGSYQYLTVARPPMQDGPFQTTALAIATLKAYGIPARGAELNERVAQATAWLKGAQAVTAEDRNFQALGLKWAGESDGVMRLRRDMLARQNADGGWAQTAYLASDAYATGETLYTLHEAGVPSSDPAYRRGVEFLLRTQKPDGSWYVKSRAPKLQPYFQSGFPYDHNQWISASATAWATMALSYAVKSETVAGR